MTPKVPTVEEMEQVLRYEKARMPADLSGPEQGAVLADAVMKRFLPTMKRVIKPRSPEEVDAIDDGGAE